MKRTYTRREAQHLADVAPPCSSLSGAIKGDTVNNYKLIRKLVDLLEQHCVVTADGDVTVPGDDPDSEDAHLLAVIVEMIDAHGAPVQIKEVSR